MRFYLAPPRLCSGTPCICSRFPYYRLACRFPAISTYHRDCSTRRRFLCPHTQLSGRVIRSFVSISGSASPQVSPGRSVAACCDCLKVYPLYREGRGEMAQWGEILFDAPFCPSDAFTSSPAFGLLFHSQNYWITVFWPTVPIRSSVSYVGESGAKPVSGAERKLLIVCGCIRVAKRNIQPEYINGANWSSKYYWKIAFHPHRPICPAPPYLTLRNACVRRVSLLKNRRYESGLVRWLDRDTDRRRYPRPREKRYSSLSPCTLASLYGSPSAAAIVGCEIYTFARNSVGQRARVQAS